MKAFFVGLIFLLAVAILTGIGILFFPLVIVFGLFLRIIFTFIFMVFFIWLLGKSIIFILGKFKS